MDPGPDGAELIPVRAMAQSKSFVVFPALGRHVAFRGNLLHGCPTELEQNQGERLSLLVNIWLHHRPLDLPCGSVLKNARLARAVAAGGIAASNFRIGRELRISEIPSDVPGAVDTPIKCGPWKLSGLKLPNRLRSSSIWAVVQAPGRPSLPRRNVESRQAAVVSLKRPASASTRGPARKHQRNSSAA